MSNYNFTGLYFAIICIVIFYRLDNNDENVENVYRFNISEKYFDTKTCC